ncbi:MAG: (Fe-S)-binding protein [Thermodesulfobacteriota bacterium]|nr:MAG: (Fe-S)-binding protein [Thermodesulfobacteriota bacterium]
MPEEEWKRLVTIGRERLFPCIQCGKCTGGCPIALVCKTFNVRRILNEVLYTEGEEVAHNKDYLWNCSACGTCMSRCPKGVDPMEMVLTLRSVLVEDGEIPAKVRDVLKSIDVRKNPWGMGKDSRTDWTRGLEVKNIADAEVLYYVCCTPAFDQRLQKVPRAIVKAFNKGGVNFGILGLEEVCCGNEIKRLGDLWNFEALREKNLENFKKYPIKQIVVTSPHCYNSFIHDYPGLDVEVKHYTQKIDELLTEGRLAFTGEFTKKVAFHDPCFLGKHNQVFDEPRRILQRVPGLNYVEFDRCRERSLCCEGGGGRMWIEAFDAKDRTANLRVREAIDLGVEVIATSCPFCLLTLEDAIKIGRYEERLKVMDIMEIIDLVLN